MAYQIQFAASAKKDREKIPKKDRDRIDKAIALLGENPRPSKSNKLTGTENLYRIRVGDYRVIYSISEKDVTVFIVRVRHRKEAYKK